MTGQLLIIAAMALTGLAITVLGAIIGEYTYNLTLSRICLAFSVLGIIMFVGGAVLLLADSIISKTAIEKEVGEMTEISSYYDYASDDEYNLVAKKELNKAVPKDTFVKIYADDFENVFIVECKFEKLFKYTATKTKVTPSSSDRKIIPKYSEDYDKDCRCECAGKACSCEG